ncbi:MAG TPA: MFS transporter [Acetobacteraceae bacterium]|nr:MFS transporter [Acetobacteraceae bacterium]
MILERGAESDSPYSWFRLGVALLLSSIGGVGMWSMVAALPAAQIEFGIARGDASLPYSCCMLGFAVGGVLMGRVADRLGVMLPVLGGAISLTLGYLAAGSATTLWQFALAYGVLIGLFGCSATFVPLLADVSHWFDRRRGLAVTICASGNYVAGAFWPPVVEHFIGTAGWRQTHFDIALFCAVTMVPLALLLRRRPPLHGSSAGGRTSVRVSSPLGVSSGVLQAALALAGVCCCVAMSMPQVQIVAYCGDMGYGVAAGAQMLSLMLACGIVSRIGSGFIADRIGGLRTLLLGSLAQMTALMLYLLMNGLTSLYIISALFGLFQGGIVPCYAIIVREHFPPHQAGTRVGIVMMATLFGMALGGWMSGAIFDLTGSYRAAFANGVAWNVGNALIVLWLLLRPLPRLARGRGATRTDASVQARG